LFKNLDFVKLFGQFGNANFYYEKDWMQVIEDASVADLGVAEWDTQTNSCKIFANMHFMVVYSAMGYTENPQKYIVKVEKSAHQTEWTYNRKDNQSPQLFDVNVSF